VLWNFSITPKIYTKVPGKYLWSGVMRVAIIQEVPGSTIYVGIGKPDRNFRGFSQPSSRILLNSLLTSYNSGTDLYLMIRLFKSIHIIL
jgi:hypothetical protein